MRSFIIAALILLPSCSWHYVAIRERTGKNEEKIEFAMLGHDLLYGSAQGKGENWVIRYPSSSLDAAVETVEARDFTAVEVNSKNVTNSVSGFIAIRGNSKVEVRLVRSMKRPDGSRYSPEAPINGTHRLRTK